MIRVAIEEVKALCQRRREINEIPLDQIEWTMEGMVIPVTPDQRESFEFTGLANVDFAEMEWWIGHVEVTAGSPKVPPPQASIEVAAEELMTELKSDPSVWSVGVTEGLIHDYLVVYREPGAPKRHQVPALWCGYSVKVQVCGRPQTS